MTHIKTLICACIISAAAALPVSDLKAEPSMDLTRWGMPNTQPADLTEIETAADEQAWWGEDPRAKDRSCRVDKIDELKAALAAASSDAALWKGWDTEGAIKEVTTPKENHVFFTYNTCWALKTNPTLEVEVKQVTEINGAKVDAGLRLIKKSGNIECGLDGDGTSCSEIYLQGNQLHWRSKVSLKPVARGFVSWIVSAVQRMSQGDFDAVCKQYQKPEPTRRRRFFRL